MYKKDPEPKLLPKSLPKSLYNIDTYTDEELFSILDLNNPTDRELEARILFLIHKYENMQNKSGEELVGFFNKIFSHFFEVEVEEEEREGDEGFQPMVGDKYSFDPKLQQTTRYGPGMFDESTIKNAQEQQNKDNQIDATKQYVPQVQNIVKEVSSDIVPVYKNLGNIVNPTSTTTYRTNDIGFTKPIAYVKDQLNPLLQQTIKRIISIDSQYRDNKQSLSTDFTFNLSDPLKDVVSLKLYSVQIPYTWYTINTAFGSNVFYIKGNVPGIDNEKSDIKIDISAGNYSPADLATAINNSIKNIGANNLDISFGTTKINYNQFTSLMTTTIDITNRYSENSYSLNFSNHTSPLASSTRSESIPGYLGFKTQEYHPYQIRSMVKLPLITDIPNTIIDNTQRLYYVDNTNNYFTVIKYIGPDELSMNIVNGNIDYSSSTNHIDFSFNIQLTITKDTTRTLLLTDISNQLAACPYITSDTEIKRIDFDSSSSFFQITMKPNRYTQNNNNINSKMAIIFPYETNTIYNPIWRGINSCFCFDPNIHIYELNTIISEYSPIPLQTGIYNINSNPYIYLKCINPEFDLSGNDVDSPAANSYDTTGNQLYYTDSGTLYNKYSKTPTLLYPDFSNNIRVDSSNIPINYVDLSSNDFIITIPNSSAIGYNITDYINIINNSIKNYNASINTDYSYASINSDNKFAIQFDINKKFTTTNYEIILTDSYLNNTMKLDSSYSGTTLSNNKSVTSFFFPQRTYQITGGYLAEIKPLNHNNKNQKKETIKSNPSKTYNSYQELQTAINNAFSDYKDTSGNHILSGTNVQLSYIGNMIQCVFTVIIQKVLTENDYSIQFIDPSLNLSVHEPGPASHLIINNNSIFFLDASSKYFTDITSAYNNGKVNGLFNHFTPIDLSKTKVLPKYYTDPNSAFLDLNENMYSKIPERNIYISQSSDNNISYESFPSSMDPIDITPQSDIYWMNDPSSNYYLNASSSTYYINSIDISLSESQTIYIKGNTRLNTETLLGNNPNTFYKLDMTGPTYKLYIINSSKTNTISTDPNGLYILDLSSNYYNNGGYNSGSIYYIDPICIEQLTMSTIYYIDSTGSTGSAVYKYTNTNNIYIVDSSKNKRYINKTDTSFIILDNSSCYYQNTSNGTINNYIDPNNLLETNNHLTEAYFIYNSPTLNQDLNALTPGNAQIIHIKSPNIYYIEKSLIPVPDYETSSWYKNLHIPINMIENSSRLSSFSTNSNGNYYSDISGYTIIEQNTITLDSTNNKITIIPYEIGVATSPPNTTNNIEIILDLNSNITSNTYTRNNLIDIINSKINALSLTIYPELLGTNISIVSDITGTEYTKIRMNINKIYKAADYRLSFYDQYSFVKCYVGVTSVRNTTWDTTLGWILGYRKNTVYSLSESIYKQPNTSIINISGETGVSTNLFNYFMICLDDYNQNHLNDGLVTITAKDTDISLPSYASKAQFSCDPTTGAKTYNTLVDSTGDYSKLTQNQIYSITELANSRVNGTLKATSFGTVTNSQSYGLGPFVKDVFAIIPMKLSGLQNGQSYVEFGGTLQNQDRIYFGPVNIHRMSIKLISDKGDVVDLNGANWSVCLVCEQLYKQNPSQSKNEK